MSHAVINNDIYNNEATVEETGRRQVVWYSQGVESKGLIIPKGTNTKQPH